jgi:hypothetical protein
LGQGLLGGTTSGGSPSGPYQLPIATSNTLGGVRIGNNITIDAGGKISVAAPFSGNYNDLSGLPTLATVATTGNYNDLTHKPSIPTDISQLADTTHILQRATNYTLPAATTTTLGGVKAGDGLSVNGDGVLSVVLDYHSLQNKPMTAGHTPPSNNVAREGDLWWNTQDGNLYIRYLNTWVVTITTTQGPAGPRGYDGAQGTQGPKGDRGDPGQIASKTRLGVVKVGYGIDVTTGGTISAQRINRVTDIPDVNGAGLADGSILVYNTVLSRWDNTVELSQENMDGGHF